MIAFSDLSAQHRSLQDDLIAAIARVVSSGQFVLGKEVVAFEEEFSRFCGTKHGIGVNSGTSALHLAMLAAGIGPGDEVITVPFTFVATVAAIRYTGAVPVFVDIDPATLTMDVTRIERVLTKRTKAIVPVHLYGHPADMDPIIAIAHTHGLVVIEDAAQAHGARYKGRRVGTLGDAACFSFYPGKNLGACGEGGMVVTNREDYARKIRMLRDWGAEKKYHHELLGFNYRMEGMQGAVLRVKLRQLNAWTETRRALASQYDKLLTELPVTIPPQQPWAEHVYHLYGIQVPQRDQIQRSLQEKGIQTGIHYPVPVHLQPWAKDLGFKSGDFPCSEAVATRELSLPLYPELTPAQVGHIADALRAALQGTAPVMVSTHDSYR